MRVKYVDNNAEVVLPQPNPKITTGADETCLQTFVYI